MRQTFSTYIHSEDSSENDESIVTDLILIKDGSEIYIKINKEIAEVVRRGEIKKKRTESVELEGIDVQTLAIIRDRVNSWVESESKATIFESFSTIEGEYEVENFQTSKNHNSIQGRYNSFSGQNTTQFDTLQFSVGKDGVSLQFDVDNESCGVVIPSSESIHYTPQDITNIDLLNKTLFDFFKLRLPEEMSSNMSDPASPEDSAVARTQRIFDRFGEVARQLDERQRDRQPLLMNDEYDVQYLLHSLLKIYFDDVRAETSTERHSSVSPRIDFLLEQHSIGIEVKRASNSMTPKRIRSELAEDKEQYRKDSNVDTLLCLIYDPDHQIRNSVEFEVDLADSPSNLTTLVTVTH